MSITLDKCALLITRSSPQSHSRLYLSERITPRHTLAQIHNVRKLQGLDYLRFYAKVPAHEAATAELVDINNGGMKITRVTEPNG
ncbi:unnamed protein product, partial [Rhizoctonia solani]